MRISGHLTASTFTRCNIVDEEDIGNAVERTGAYVERRAQQRPKVARLQKADTTRTLEPGRKAAQGGGGA
jgi:hypothetical protein